MIICQACRTELLDGSVFCDSCGIRLEMTRSEPINPPSNVQNPSGERLVGLPHMPAPDNSLHPPVAVLNGSASHPQAGYRTIGDGETSGTKVIKATIVKSGRVIVFPWNEQRVLLIGRRDPAHGILPDIDLTDDGGAEYGVSRNHARITMGTQIDPESATTVRMLQVEDNGSSNGTYVARQQIPPHRPALVQSGDEVRFGRMAIRFIW